MHGTCSHVVPRQNGGENTESGTVPNRNDKTHIATTNSMWKMRGRIVFFNPTSRFRRIESKSRILPSIQLFHPSTACLLLLCLGLQKLITFLEGGGGVFLLLRLSRVFGVPCKINWQDPCATLAAPGPNGLASNLNLVTSLDLASKNLPQRRTFSHTVRLRSYWAGCQSAVVLPTRLLDCMSNSGQLPPSFCPIN